MKLLGRRSPVWRPLISLCLFVGLSFWLFAPALAAGGDGVLNSIDAAFKPQQSQWSAALRGAATALFWMLAGIDFAYHAAMQVMDSGELNDVLKGLGKRILRYGFFFALLKFSDTWLVAIIASFVKLGSGASGLSAEAMSPDAIVGKGTQVALDMFKKLEGLGMWDSIVMSLILLILAVLIFACFLWVAIQVLVTQVEIYLVIGTAPVLLGMGGSTWTKDMAAGVYKYAVQVGMKLLILYCVCGIGMSVMGNAKIDGENLIESTLSLFGMACVFAFLAIKAPAVANGMLSGSSSLSAGDLVTSSLGLMAGGAAAVGGGLAAASAAGNMASSAGQAAMGGLAGATGLAQAVGAGLNAAQDLGKSGMGAMAHAGAEVMGHGLNMGASAVSSAVAGQAASFSERVAESTGGQIAQSIEASRGGSFGPSSGSGDASVNVNASAPSSGGGNTSSQSAAPAPGSSDKPSAATALHGFGDMSTSSTGSKISAERPSGDTGLRTTATAATAGTGNASPSLGNSAGASLSGADLGPQAGANFLPDGAKSNSDVGNGAGRRDGPSMADRLSGMKDFVPDDATPHATAQIDTNARSE